MRWGLNAGCNFFMDKCLTPGTTPAIVSGGENYFCNDVLQAGCTANSLGMGECGIYDGNTDIPSYMQYWTDDATKGGGLGAYGVGSDFCPYIPVCRLFFFIIPLLILKPYRPQKIVGSQLNLATRVASLGRLLLQHLVASHQHLPRVAHKRRIPVCGSQACSQLILLLLCATDGASCLQYECTATELRIYILNPTGSNNAGES